jgi:hypothetical protein
MRPRLLDLPHGHQTVIDEADWPAVCDLTVYRGANGYAYFSTWANGRSNPRTLHGYLMQPPKGAHVDHINGDKLDNRRANLRVVSPQRNQINRKRVNRNNSTGTRGVGYAPRLSRVRPWRAQITVDGRNLHLGMFESEAAAVEARKSAELKHYGELCP